MGKKTNTALVAGGLGLLAILGFNALKGGKVIEAGGKGGNGGNGGLLDELLGNGEKILEDTFVDVGALIKAWRPLEGVYSPTDAGITRSITGHPALDTKVDLYGEQLFVNRETGEVYPVDEAGRQRARVDEQGNVVGRYIADPAGVPYGTVSMELKSKGEYQGVPYARQIMTSLTQGAGSTGQQVITGIIPSTGQAYTYYGYGSQGW